MSNTITVGVIQNELSSIESMAASRGELRSGNLYGDVLGYLGPIYKSGITIEQKEMIENELLSFTTRHPKRGGGGYKYLMEQLHC